MTPILSNPSLPAVKTLSLTHPFGGVYRRNLLPQPEGNLWYLHRCSLQDGSLGALPGYINPTYAMTKMGWAGVEQTRGVINRPSGDDFWVVTSERVHRYPFTADPITYLGSLGTGTKVGTTITIAAPVTNLDELGIMRDARMLADGNWHTVADVPSSTTITCTDALNTFAAKDVVCYNKDFTGYDSGFYGPRYCWFGEDLIMVSLYGTCVYPYGTTELHLGAFTHTNRGIDVINFAGRPVLLGAYETPGDYSAVTPTLFSDMLRWPTRSDYRDWTSYGSGFLYLHTDGSGIRCGANWGEDAYILTGTSIYQLIETGIDASNPITFQRHQAKIPSPPNSNAVKGLRGIYFWTKKGPMLFDGNTVHDLSLELELDLKTFDTDLLNEGVHVWADEYTRTIRFHNHKLPCPTLQYIFWEDSGTWTTLDEDYMYLAGTGQVYDHPIGIQSTAITTATDVSREQKQDQGTEDMIEDQDFLCRATWRGMTMEEGPHVNKTIQQIRMMYTTTLTGSTFKCSMVPDVHDDTIPDANQEVIVPTPSENLQMYTFTMGYTKEAPIWRLDLHFPPGTKIYQICIDYTVAGDIEADLT